MNKLQRGLLFAAIQVALVSSLGAKLVWDRGHEPRGWALTRGYDPDLVIRGRYVNISLMVKADKVFGNLASGERQGAVRSYGSSVSLAVENGRVVAIPADHPTGMSVSGAEVVDGETLATLYPPVVYFLPEHAANPLLGRAGGTSVLEVTVPKKGPPRPIRFGIKVGEQITPLPEE